MPLRNLIICQFETHKRRCKEDAQRCVPLTYESAKETKLLVMSRNPRSPLGSSSTQLHKIMQKCRSEQMKPMQTLIEWYLDTRSFAYVDILSSNARHVFAIR